jgi:hypothetical protein
MDSVNYLRQEVKKRGKQKIKVKPNGREDEWQNDGEN